jgi:hypothetical protein
MGKPFFSFKIAKAPEGEIQLSELPKNWFFSSEKVER